MTRKTENIPVLSLVHVHIPSGPGSHPLIQKISKPCHPPERVKVFRWSRQKAHEIKDDTSQVSPLSLLPTYILFLSYREDGCSENHRRQCSRKVSLVARIVSIASRSRVPCQDRSRGGRPAHQGPASQGPPLPTSARDHTGWCTPRLERVRAHEVQGR